MSGMDQRWWQTVDLGAESGPRMSFSSPTWGNRQVLQVDLTSREGSEVRETLRFGAPMGR